MAFVRFVGSVLRAVGVLWFLYGGASVFGGLAGVRPSDGPSFVVRGVIGMLCALLAFKLGTWLKARQAPRPIGQQMWSVRAKWWGAEQGFRLAVFLAIAWAVGAVVWLDEDERTLSVVLAPSLGILMLYLGHRTLVVQPSKPEADEPEVQEVPQEAAPTHSIATLTPAERHRAMAELTQRMKG